MVSWPWSELGLPGPAGLPEIRRAYAHRLKTAHPEEDPEGFQRLHDAYQTACRLARKAGRTPPPDQAGERFPDWSQAERSPEEETPQESEEPDTWDFERLFAEGEAEEQEARRRKLEELREKNRDRYKAQERDQRRRAADEEEAWAAVMAAAHALELLYTAGAPLAQWQRFFNGPTFWSARANLDFLFALEDFLEALEKTRLVYGENAEYAYGCSNCAAACEKLGRMEEAGGWGEKYREEQQQIHCLPKDKKCAFQP